MYQMNYNQVNEYVNERRAFAFEIIEKPAERAAPDSLFIKGIALADGQARARAFATDSLPVLQIRNKIRPCADTIVQHRDPPRGLGALVFKDFSLPLQAKFSKAKALGRSRIPFTKHTIYPRQFTGEDKLLRVA